MKKCRKAISILLAFVMLFTGIPLTASAEEGKQAAPQVAVEEGSQAAPQTAVDEGNQTVPQAAAGTANRLDLIYGTNGTITRAEWLHDLAVLFEMKVEEDNLPDNYFSDITEQDAYYRDILLTVEFGVIAIGAGGKVLPNEPVTREFAAHTLNYCLGYKLDEGESCTLRDAAKLEYPEDAQIAVNRGWLQAVNQEFRPQEKLQEAEMRRMFEDASAVLQSTEISDQYKNTYQFADGVIELPQDINYEMAENGVITIYDCPKEIRKGDSFAIYINGLPSVYQAKNVTVSGGATQIETTGTESEEMLEQADAQGNAESDLGLAEAAEGTDITYIVGGTEEASFEDGQMYKKERLDGNKKINAIKASRTLKLGKGMKVQFNCTLSDVSVDYKIKTFTANKEVYVSAKGTMEASCNVSVDALQAAGIPSSLDLVKIPVGGVGMITVSMEYAFSGKLSLTYKAGFSEGVQYTSRGGFREVHKFEKKNFTIASEAEVSAGVKASLSITAIPLVKGKVAARVGAKTHFSSDTYNDGKAPKTCIDISSYLYASAEASLSLAFVDKNLWKESITIFDQRNSPIRVVYHYEDNHCVPVCTRNPGKYYTSYSSKYGSSGFGYGDSSGTDRDGNVVAIYTYSLDEDENATITKFMGNASALMIPSELDGYTVVAIGDKAFQGNKNIRSVIIPDTVTKIGARAFADCTNLGNVILSSNLEEMGSKAFARCELLTDIEIPKSLTICHVDGDGYEGDLEGAYTGPFYECSGLEVIRFESGTNKIAKRLFAGCTGLKEISIPNIVTVIGEKAFEGCTNLKEIEIPDSVTEIEWCAFSRCRNMETAIIGDGVTQISADAFANCDKLSNVRLSKNLVEMGNKAFARCESLKEIEIPKSLTTCHVDGDGYEGDLEWAYTGPFYECSGLEVIRFESGTNKIAKRLFAGCTGLKEITIPDIATVIGEKAFERCTNLKKIEIPESVTELEWCAFSQCSNMETVVINNGVKQMDANAFAGCKKLSNITLSENCDIIDESVFKDCSSLASIKIPNTVKYIRASAFENSGLKEITLPESVQLIEDAAFKNSALEKAVVSDNITRIGREAFASCAALTQISLGKKLEEIGNNAFANCDALPGIAISDSVKVIGTHIFEDCDVLTDVKLGTGLTTIPSYAFHGCVKLPKIELPYRIATVKDHAFTNCVKLLSITVPRATASIDETAFSYPGSMTMYGVSGTYAETYAKKMGMNFVKQEKKAVKVTLSQTELTLARGAKGMLQISVEPADFTDEVAWKSADPSVAEVSSDGVVTAKGIGNTTIKITVGDCSASCAVKVVQPVTGISLNERDLEMDAGESCQLIAHVRPDNANNREVTWTSSEPKVAAVDENGTVSALSKGTAVITVAAKDGSNVQASCNVTVKNNRYLVTDINGMESSHNYANDCTDSWVYTKPGAASLKVTFDAKTELEDGFDYLLIYDGADGQVGKYTGTQLAGAEILVPGDTVKIQLATDDGGTAWGFKVSQIVEGSVGEREKQVISGTASYEKSLQDEAFQLDARIEKGNGTLSYRSLDETVVTVDSFGLVSIQGVGATAIEVSASATDLYESASMRIEITITDSGSGEEPREDIAAAEIEVSDLTYNGKEQHVKAAVRFKGKLLSEGTDYLLSGDKTAADVGTYTLIIKGIGSYKGSVAKDYRVSCRHRFDNGKVTREATCKREGERTYTCRICRYTETETVPKTPHKFGAEKVTTKATVSRNGAMDKICSICGDKKSSAIYAAKNIKLSAAGYIYDGKAKKPAVTIRDSKGNKLKNGTDYKLTYAGGRKNVGSYGITVKFLGKYGGTAKKSFTIYPRPTSLAKLTPKAKGMAISWKKQPKQISGYEVAYSTSSKFAKKATKSVTVNKGKTAKTIARLKGKKRYYVRIRTYMSVKGKKYYSSWSKAKSVMTKK